MSTSRSILFTHSNITTPTLLREVHKFLSFLLGIFFLLLDFFGPDVFLAFTYIYSPCNSVDSSST
jgi:hypothetical protein